MSCTLTKYKKYVECIKTCTMTSIRKTGKQIFNEILAKHKQEISLATATVDRFFSYDKVKFVSLGERLSFGYHIRKATGEEHLFIVRKTIEQIQADLDPANQKGNTIYPLCVFTFCDGKMSLHPEVGYRISVEKFTKPIMELFSSIISAYHGW